MYKIGMPTLLELPDIDSTLSFCEEMKLELIEIGMNHPEFLPDKLDAEKLRRISEEKGIEFTIHLPEKFDIATFHEPIRKAFVEWIINCIKWGKKAGVKLFTMHLSNGIYYTLPDKKEYLYNVYDSKYIKNMQDSFMAVYNVLDDQTLCIENCANFHLPFIKKALQQAPFAVTWDIGHDAASGFKDKAIIENCRLKVAHMHLHDCKGISSHKELYTGEIDIDAMVKFAKLKKIRMIVEVKTLDALKRSIKALRERENLSQAL